MQDKRKDARKIALEKEAATERRASSAAKARGIAERAKKTNIEFDVPDIADITVVVPRGAAISSSDVDQEIEKLRHEIAAKTPVAFGSRVASGDQAELDVMGYHNGELFFTMMNQWVIVAENPHMPGFFAEVENMFVGEEKVISITLGANYPNPQLAGRPAAFAVKVRTANRPLLPEVNEAFWLGLGAKNEEEGRALLEDELIKRRADAMVDMAKNLVLDEIFMRTGATIADDDIDDALNAMWREEQGDAMAARNAALKTQSTAREQFIQDQEVRAKMRRDLFERALFDRVIAENNIAADANEVMRFILELVDDTSLSQNRVHEMLRADGESAAMQQQLRDLRALEWIMRHVNVTFA